MISVRNYNKPTLHYKIRIKKNGSDKILQLCG